MATITRFEDIDAWVEARRLVGRIYELTSVLPFSKDFGLCSQIQRASVSIMSNIAEGFDRSTTKEFVQFLFIAKGSASEVRSHLHVALDLQYINQQKFDELKSDLEKTTRLLSGFIRYLQKPDNPYQRRVK